MDRSTLVTALALAATAFLAGGGVVGIAGLVGHRPAIVSLAIVAAIVLSTLFGTAWSRKRHGTPYW